MRRAFLLVVAVAFLSCGFSGSLARAAEDLVDNPLYASWAKLKPGSSVTLAMDTTAAGQQMQGEMTQKLAEVTPDHVVIDTSNKMQVMGQTQTTPPQKVMIRAKVPKDQADRSKLPPGMKGETKDVGDETVEAAGKSYVCKVTEFSGDMNGMTAKGKFWRNDDVPGGLVRTEVNTTGAMVSTIVMKLMAIDLK